MIVVARVGFSALVWGVLAAVEVVGLMSAFTRCAAVGHDGIWDYKATSGEWLCLCRHCDVELGRHRP